MKRNRTTEHQNREGAADSWQERPAPFPVPWGELMNTLNLVATQAWTDPTALAEELDAQPGLASYLADGLSRLAQSLLEHERAAYLAANPDQVANGYAKKRPLYWRTVPFHIAIPRTRGDFYPSCLSRYQRKIPHLYGQLLRDLLLHTKSFAELARTVRRLGLPFSPNEIEPLLNELHDEAKQFLERPLNADYLCLMLDAKTLYIRDEKGILEAVVKTWILADRLQRSSWLRPNGRLAAHLREWLRYFQKQYEPELISPCHTQTS